MKDKANKNWDVDKVHKINDMFGAVGYTGRWINTATTFGRLANIVFKEQLRSTTQTSEDDDLEQVGIW